MQVQNIHYYQKYKKNKAFSAFAINSRNDAQRYSCWKLEPFEHTVQQVTKHSLFPDEMKLMKWNGK